MASSWLALAGVFVPANGLAFCRTTSCEAPHDGANCRTNAEGCATEGLELFWPGGCVSFTVQSASPQGQPDAAVVASATQTAFERWTSVDCGNGPPSIQAQDLGFVDCGRHTFDAATGNANIVLYQQDSWPYPATSDAIALTSVTFNVHTGEIYDADIELNAVAKQFSAEPGTPGAYDLTSVLTHEVGHFLGLSHTLLETSTMFGSYRELQAAPYLSDDDVAGVCAIYPASRQPDNADCLPRNGLVLTCEPSATVAPKPINLEPDSGSAANRTSDGGGCQLVPARGSGLPWLLAIGGILRPLSYRVRRRRRQAADPGRTTSNAGASL